MKTATAKRTTLTGTRCFSPRRRRGRPSLHQTPIRLTHRRPEVERAGFRKSCATLRLRIACGMARLKRRGAIGFALACTIAAAPSAAAAGLDDVSDQWLPRSDGAAWTYTWSNSAYSPIARTERYRLQARTGTTFRLRWDEVGGAPFDAPSSGIVDFQHTDAGLVNVNYQSNPAPRQYPVLCASPMECGNSLAGAMHMLTWGTRSPMLAEPLLRGTRWGSRGGADSDVASENRYSGAERITVAAFPGGVDAAKVESRITQAGALGDPFGSGIRTVWWVRGVGPVRIRLDHAGGEVSSAELMSTNLAPRPLPSDANLLPFTRGDRSTFRWRNTMHMKKWSRQQGDVTQVVNGTAQVAVKHLSGPIAVAGAYLFSTRLTGVSLVSGATRAATGAKFPALGPRSAAQADRLRFYTPFDLLIYGYNPILPVPAPEGVLWRSSREGRDWRLYGVTGDTRVVATDRRVRTPAGLFRTTVVRSQLTQQGYRFGSGTRTAYFAAGKGLVKLVFRHRDGSTSLVERTS